MAERKGQTPYNPFEDYHKVYIDKSGVPQEARVLAMVFKDKPADIQARLALHCLRTEIDPFYVYHWVTDAEVKKMVQIWDEGKEGRKSEASDNLHFRSQRAKQILQDDEQLIQTLSPFISQADLARILTLKKYQHASIEDLQTLYGGHYRLLHDYLGPRRHFKRDMPTTVFVPLPDLPDELFSDELVSYVLFVSQRQTARPIYYQNGDQVFIYLDELKSSATHPAKIEFVQKLIEHFSNSDQQEIPGIKGKIEGSQRDIEDKDEIALSDFPSRHQREYAYCFINKTIGPVDILIGDPRTRKSGAALAAMKVAGVKTPIIVCPSGGVKEGWKSQIIDICEEGTKVLTIDSVRQLKALAANGATTAFDYVIVGYQLLSVLSIEESEEDFRNLKAKLGLDGLIADEVHLAKEPEAECSQQVYLLSKALSESAPRIAMTGTAVVNSVEDLDDPTRIIMPYKFKEPGDFTKALRNNPQLISGFLYGNEIVTRWTFKDIFGRDLPQERIETVPFTPFHHLLYQYVHGDNTIASESKRGFLRQAGLDPLLVRKYYYPPRVRESIAQLRLKLDERQDDKQRNITLARIRALEERIAQVTTLSNPTEALSQMLEAHRQFLKWMETVDPNMKFDEDFLVTLGYDNLTLWCFFNLPDGVDQFARNSHQPDLKRDWQGKQGLFSSKYIRLMAILDQYQASADTKALIGSGFYQTYVTSGIEDIGDGDELAFLSLYDHLRQRYGRAAELKIDGKVSIEPRRGELAARERNRRTFRADPNHLFMPSTLRSCRLGIDLSILPTEANRHIRRLITILLDEADTYADKFQFWMRGMPADDRYELELITLRATNPEQPTNVRFGFIDLSLSEASEYKRLLSQWTLDFVPLTKEEEDFVKAHQISVRRDSYYTETPQMHLNTRLFSRIKALGARGILRFFQEEGFEGMTNADFFATYYPQTEEFGISGHNARAVAEVIKRFKQMTGKDHMRISSIGAGSGILQNALGEAMVNVDLLSDILQTARLRQEVNSDYVTAEGSYLPLQDNMFDVTDGSLFLHWTSNRHDYLTKVNHLSGTARALILRQERLSERIRAIKELNRVTKDGGLVTITLPHSHLSSEQFKVWRETLEKYFGLRTITDLPSGLIRATDFRVEPISWIFNLQKVGEVAADLSSAPLEFDFDADYDIMGKLKAGRDAQDVQIPIRPFIPHKEFEIVDPNGQIHQLTYQSPDILERELEKMLADITTDDTSVEIGPKYLKEDVNVLQLGSEEYGLYRGLLRQVRSWELDPTQAGRLARQALEIFLEENPYTYDIFSARNQLIMLAEDLKGEGKS